jgi:hypothetical protein
MSTPACGAARPRVLLAFGAALLVGFLSGYMIARAKGIAGHLTVVAGVCCANETSTNQASRLLEAALDDALLNALHVRRYAWFAGCRSDLDRSLMYALQHRERVRSVYWDEAARIAYPRIRQEADDFLRRPSVSDETQDR